MIQIFWDVAPRSVANRYYSRGESKFLQDLGIEGSRIMRI
jgi:hypothetical protein